MKKALFLVVGIAFLLCLGTVYSYSVFRVPLEKTLGIKATQSGLPYMLALFFYALFMPLTGRYLRRIEPRFVAMTGGTLMGIGWILASFFPSFPLVAFFYGVLGGIGVGIGYGVPLAVSATWYPENPGFALGTTVIGFGLSPLVTAPILRRLIDQFGPFLALRVMGVVFLLVTVALSLFLRFPQGVTPTHHTPPPSQNSPTLLRHKNFWLLWFSFFVGTFVGLTAISITAPVAQEMIGISYARSATFVSLFALFNGLGRPLFGHLVDRRGFSTTAILSFSLLLGALLLFIIGRGSVISYTVSFLLLWMNLGAWLAIAPSSTVKFFGRETYAQNYGLVFTAYGVSALSGTFVASLLRDLTGSYLSIFFLSLFLVAGSLAIVLHARRRSTLEGGMGT